MWTKYWLAILVVALSSALLWSFAQIIRYGRVEFVEASPAVLVAEIVLLAACWLFGLVVLARALWRAW